MTYPSIHKVNPEKEKKSTIKLAAILTVASFVVCFIAYANRGNEGFQDDDILPYLIGAFIFDGLCLAIVFSNTSSRIKHYELQLLDEDHFNITTNKGTEKYHPGRITTIEFYKSSIKRVNLNSGRYPADIPDNLENYSIVTEYFSNMAKRLNKGVRPK